MAQQNPNTQGLDQDKKFQPNTGNRQGIDQGDKNVEREFDADEEIDTDSEIDTRKTAQPKRPSSDLNS